MPGVGAQENMEKLRIIFLVLTVAYSMVWFAAYRFAKAERPMPIRYHPTPIETTTSGERARGERSFEVASGQQVGVTR
jgi:hypothetical protein